MTMLKCSYAKDSDKCFNQGEYYGLYRDAGSYVVIDDEGDEHEVCLTDCSDNEWRPVSSTARLVEITSTFTTVDEEEESKRIEKNIQSEETLCDVALAYQLSQIQKYIREYDSDIELVVHKDFIAINDEHCREYRGNVEQILRYIKASGELTKVADEMDRRN